jgi:hypothetical protein
MINFIRGDPRPAGESSGVVSFVNSFTVGVSQLTHDGLLVARRQTNGVESPGCDVPRAPAYWIWLVRVADAGKEKGMTISFRNLASYLPVHVFPSDRHSSAKG